MNQPTDPPAPPRTQNATILFIGFLILLTSCSLILAVRVHARLDGMTKAIETLAEATKENNAILLRLAPSRSRSDEKAPTVPQAPGAEDAAARPTSPPRSPLPQPGEEITTPLPAVAIGEREAAKPIAPAPADGAVVPWDQAHLHMGRTITVEGKIIGTKRQETICFLNFTDDPAQSDRLYMVVFKGQFDGWGGAPEDYFLNKTVRVTGKIEDHRGRPQIKIQKKEQVLSVQ